ncbi:MAG: DJ-1/PfpI family protein [Treponema sp.]|jgi:4-methyl-5(b-hydroxyethyl)-thiazole monophosphate biosynthesis|nr:DJ-1/PfpI family protein [Treponema sp.]
MAKHVLALLADGFEEVEAISPIDYLRRAGIKVTTASISGGRTVTGAHGLAVNAEILLSGLGRADRTGLDGVLLPGGMPGASNLAASADTGALLRELAGAGKLVCAICASPAVVLAPLGLLSGRRFTCFPGMEEQVSGAKWSEDRVVSDGNIITSRAAGTAGEWACAIIRRLAGDAAADKVAAAVLL